MDKLDKNYTWKEKVWSTRAWDTSLDHFVIDDPLYIKLHGRSYHKAYGYIGCDMKRLCEWSGKDILPRIEIPSKPTNRIPHELVIKSAHSKQLYGPKVSSLWLCWAERKYTVNEKLSTLVEEPWKSLEREIKKPKCEDRIPIIKVQLETPRESTEFFTWRTR
ncbi:hypothetical protein Tco_0961736 [Tanacetum coccineum]